MRRDCVDRANPFIRLCDTLAALLWRPRPAFGSPGAGYLGRAAANEFVIGPHIGAKNGGRRYSQPGGAPLSVLLGMCRRRFGRSSPMLA